MKKEQIEKAANLIDELLKKVALSKEDVKAINDKLEPLVADAKANKRFFKRLG